MSRGAPKRTYTITPRIVHRLSMGGGAKASTPVTLFVVRLHTGRELCQCENNRDARKIVRALNALKLRPPKSN